MANQEFYILTVDGLGAEDAELFSAFAFDAGACGISEDLPFTQSGEKYEPVTLESGTESLKVYFEDAPPAAWVEEMKSKFSEARFAVHSEANRDWLAEWKKGFTSFPLDDEKNIWIVPSWLNAPTEAKKIIRIDPGMAFGTGTHETTRVAANLIIQAVSSAKRERALDVGTGTGILAMLLAHLGYRAVVANDVDPEARRVARENLEANQLTEVQVVDESLDQIDGCFDLVVANIIDGVLVQIQRELKSRVAPRGQLILTGILQEREAQFLKNFEHDDFEIIERRQLGEWVGFHMRARK